MKYFAVFDDDFISHFKTGTGDKFGSVLFINDKYGLERGIEFKPLNKPVFINDAGDSLYLTQGHIQAFLDYEQYERYKYILNHIKSTES